MAKRKYTCINPTTGFTVGKKYEVDLKSADVGGSFYLMQDDKGKTVEVKNLYPNFNPNGKRPVKIRPGMTTINPV